MTPQALLHEIHAAGAHIEAVDGALRVRSLPERFVPYVKAMKPELLELLSPLQVHPDIEWALPRELFPDGKGRSFLIDAGVKAKVRLLDAVPDGILEDEWRQAVVCLSEARRRSSEPTPKASPPEQAYARPWGYDWGKIEEDHDGAPVLTFQPWRRSVQIGSGEAPSPVDNGASSAASAAPVAPVPLDPISAEAQETLPPAVQAAVDRVIAAAKSDAPIEPFLNEW